MGPQGTDEAAAAAERQALAFLRHVDALPGEPPDTRPDYFHMYQPLPKPPGESYEVYVDNFELVPWGRVYASVDGRALIPDEPFYPVMLSEAGHVYVFGYKSARLGRTLAEAQARLAAAG